MTWAENITYFSSRTWRMIDAMVTKVFGIFCGKFLMRNLSEVVLSATEKITNCNEDLVFCTVCLTLSFTTFLVLHSFRSFCYFFIRNSGLELPGFRTRSTRPGRATLRLLLHLACYFDFAKAQAQLLSNLCATERFLEYKLTINSKIIEY